MSNLNTIAACLLTNAAYAAPTAVVARMISGHADPRVAAVYFVWLESSDPPKALEAYLRDGGIRIARVDPKLMQSLEGFASGRLPGAVFARMHLARILAEEPVRRFVYLDGDIDVPGSIGPLADIDVPEGFLATADGYQDVILNPDPDKRRQWAAHAAGIGLEPGERYFNNGVIVADMDDWKLIGSDALKYFMLNRAACKHLDQDALNAVCRGRRCTLSPRFNFQRAYFHAGIEGLVKPHVVHFHGASKPWRAMPLTRTWRSRAAFAASMPQLADLWKLTPPGSLRLGQRLALHGRSFISEAKARRFAPEHNAQFRAYVQRTVFADGPLA